MLNASFFAAKTVFLKNLKYIFKFNLFKVLNYFEILILKKLRK
jgi:hypothetical protein